MKYQQMILFGCGKMGTAYGNVLRSLACLFTAVGHSKEGSERFAKEQGCSVQSGGWQEWQADGDVSGIAAIVAVPVEHLADCTLHLIRQGVRHILLEKPGGLNRKEIFKVAEAARASDTKIHIAYNRRFYAASLAAERQIEQDGGVLSYHMEITEIPERILPNVSNPLTRAGWFLANSTHVVDLAHYLCGEPVTQKGLRLGGLDWHPAGSRFVGHGLNANGACFTYHANWEGPGTWKLEIVTQAHKLVFRPMERLSLLPRGQFQEVPAEVDYSMDEQFKPGVYLQTKAFVGQEEHLSRLPDIHSHADRLDTLLAAVEVESR